MHPQAPALVQHGSPRGKHALVHCVPPHVAAGVGGIGRVGGVEPPLEELEPPELELVWLPWTQFPKLQTRFVEAQLVQALPPCPHASSAIPFAQTPLLQHPLAQLVESQPAAGASSPPPTVASSPVAPPPGAVLRPSPLPVVPLLPPL